jgi:hypothetical protein
MVEYVGESRIDGYPLVKITNDKYTSLFLEHFRTLKNEFGDRIKVMKIDSLEDIDGVMSVKITMYPSRFKEEFKLFERTIRLKKLENLDEYKD